MHTTVGTSVVLALVLLGAMAAGTPSAAALEPAAREPIAIRGNDGFRAENGVVGGSGTAEDPYVIEGWAIDATWSTGISIQDTDAAFVVRDVRVDSESALFDGVYVRNATGGRLEALSISGARVGIHLDGAADLSVVRSGVEGNQGNGISVLRGSQVSILGNRLVGNAIGTWVYATQGAVVTGNDVASSTEAGIYLHGSRDVAVTGNNVTQDVYGIYLFESSNVTVSGNRAWRNVETGVGLLKSGMVAVEENRLDANGFGIFLFDTSNATLSANEVVGNFYGLLLQESRDVAVVGNSLVDNGQQAVAEHGARIVWHAGYPEGGNYWSDYLGVDACWGPYQSSCPGPDGIGDTPYPIDGDDSDPYPLVRAEVDTYPPEVAIVEPADGAVVTASSVRTSGTSSDPVGEVARVEVRSNDGPWQLATGTLSWSATVDVSLGTNRIEARAWDRMGHGSDLASVQVERRLPLNQPPVAAFLVAPAQGNLLTAFRFDASGSEDPDGDLEGIEVRWDWESDGVWDTIWSRERTAGHRFATEGTYAVRLEVRDPAGSTDITTRDVRVWAVAVGPSIDWASLGAVATVALVAFTVAIVATRRARRRARGLSVDRHASWDAVLRDRR